MIQARQIIAALHLARKAIALVGAMLFTLLVLSPAAQAGCGDYVFVRDAQGRLVRASTLAMNGENGSHSPRGDCSGPDCPAHAAPELPLSLPAELPCEGPNCSGRSQFPAVPAPLPAPQRISQETTVLLQDGDDSYPAAAMFERASSARQHEIHFPQSIFHPPR